MNQLVIAGHCFTGTFQFGKHLVLDLDGCDTTAISEKATIENYAASIIKEIKMTAYGEPILAHFGHNDPVSAGWTLVQLIETSSVVAHFSPYLRRAHIDIFSCRPFDTVKAIRHSATVFGAITATVTVINR